MTPTSPSPESRPEPQSVPTEISPSTNPPPSGPSRRHLLATGALAGLAGRVALGGGAAALIGGTARAADIGPQSTDQRIRAAKRLRESQAFEQSIQPKPQHPDNGDEATYPDRRGNFSKCLLHDANGVVDSGTYAKYLNALSTGNPADFLQITLGSFRKLVSPQAAYAYHPDGPDSHHLNVPAAPPFASARMAAEMVELYWQANTRDVPFLHYETDPLIAEACAELSVLSDYAGPNVGGQVVPQFVFRHSQFIDVIGPYVSQFLLQTIPIGNFNKVQRFDSPVPGEDYGVTEDSWFRIQIGEPQAQDANYQSGARYIASGRDLAEWVHRDPPFQAYIDAANWLCDIGPSTFNQSNPLLFNSTQEGFVTWGKSMILDLVARAANAALKAGWYQKWLVHRRVRPEKFGGYVHKHLTGQANYDFHGDVLGSQALQKVFAKYGTYFIPMSFPEGCPTHPAYPSGHACTAGACSTMIKALFDENFILPSPVQANADGTALVPWKGSDLTVKGEIEKLSFNTCMGRDWAGIHWRSDLEEGMRLGEKVAIGILRDHAKTFNENFAGFTFTNYDGQIVTIT
jgi:hypothetical protein